MPNRVLREGLLTSHAWNSLGIEVRETYIRLLLVVDDFGCFDGRLEVIAARCFPTLRFDALVDPTLDEAMIQLHRAGLIVRYSNRGRPYVAITQWWSDFRGNRKFPAPPVDVDLPRHDGKPLRGAYGKKIGWTNPPGSAPVSILLDLDGRAAVPQPPEWRPPSHCTVVTGDPVSDDQIVTAGSAPVTTRHELEVEEGLGKEVGVGVGESSVTTRQSLTTPTATTTTANGNLIEFRNGGFVGLTEEQRVKWQAMFDDLRIPDQVDRAAAWLDVHPDERMAIEKQGLGFGQFIVRWLLREARSPHTGRAS